MIDTLFYEYMETLRPKVIRNNAHFGRALAEEAYQEACIKANDRGHDKFEDKAALESYLSATCHGLLRNDQGQERYRSHIRADIKHYYNDYGHQDAPIEVEMAALTAEYPELKEYIYGRISKRELTKVSGMARQTVNRKLNKIKRDYYGR